MDCLRLEVVSSIVGVSVITAEDVPVAAALDEGIGAVGFSALERESDETFRLNELCRELGCYICLFHCRIGPTP